MTIPLESLKQRIAKLINPEWYVELFAIALERSNGNASNAFEIADGVYKEMPRAPKQEDSAKLQKPLVKPSRLSKFYGEYRIKNGFTGKKEDSIGRTQCYTSGQHVACNTNSDSPTSSDASSSTPAEPKKSEREEWDGSIEQDAVDNLGHPRYVTSWDFYDNGGRPYHQHIYVVEGKYNPFPDDEDFNPITVFRWESLRSGNTTDSGEWTKDRNEALRGGRKYAEENHQEEPPEDEESEDEEFEDEEFQDEEFDDDKFEPSDEKHRKMEADARKIFESIDEKELAVLLGIPGKPGEFTISKSDVKKYKSPYPADGTPDEDAYGVTVSIQHPSLEECNRFVGIDADGKKFIKNEILVIKKEGRGGLGAQIFSSEVENAKKLGYSYIKTHAAGNYGSLMNGYYTWPLFGYDQDVKELRGSLLKRVSNTFPSAVSVQDIFDMDDIKLPDSAVAKIKENRWKLDDARKKPRKNLDKISGADWWLTFGGDLYDAKFNLEKESRSLACLKNYRESTKG